MKWDYEVPFCSFVPSLNQRPISHAMIVQSEDENVFNVKQFSNKPLSHLSPKVQQGQWCVVVNTCISTLYVICQHEFHLKSIWSWHVTKCIKNTRGHQQGFTNSEHRYEWYTCTTTLTFNKSLKFTGFGYWRNSTSRYH